MAFKKINKLVYHYQWLKQDERPTLVFINSLGSDLRIWGEVIENVFSTYNILVFDKPGHGLTQAVSSNYRIQDYAYDLKELLRVLGINKIYLIGISIGGLIAMKFTLLYPSIVEKLVVSNTAAKIGSDEMWKDRILHLTETGLPANAKPIVSRWFSESYLTQNVYAESTYSNMLIGTDLPSYLVACEALMQEDLRDEIASISVPTLCIGSDKDVATPPEDLFELEQAIYSASYKQIDQTAHLPCIEKPLAYTQILLDFFKIYQYEKG